MVRLILLRLCESYFRHRWLYWLPCLLMAGAAYFYVINLPATYVTHGTLYVQDKTLLSSLTALQSDGYTWITPAQATVSELSELLSSKAFIRAIVASTDLEVTLTKGPDAVESTLEEARSALWVQALGNNLVMISAAHEMPRVTHQLVSATIEAYLQWQTNLTRNDSVAAQKFFADLITSYQAAVDTARLALNNYLATRPRPLQGERNEQETAEIARLQTVVDHAEERLNRAQDQEEQARLALVQTESDVRQSYSVVDAPARPLNPERSLKELLLTLIMFMVAGVGLSVTALIGSALLDQSFHFPLDVQQALQLPVLALVTETPIKVTKTAAAEQRAAEPLPAAAPTNGAKAPRKGKSSPRPTVINGAGRLRSLLRWV